MVMSLVFFKRRDILKKIRKGDNLLFDEKMYALRFPIVSCSPSCLLRSYQKTRPVGGDERYVCKRQKEYDFSPK